MWSLVVEVPAPGEDHRHAVTVRRLHDLLVADGTPGLYHRLHTCLCQRLDPVRKREEGVARGCRAPHPPPRLLYGRLGGVHPAHLARPHSYGRTVLDEDYGVALDGAGDPPGEEEVVHLLRRGVLIGYDFVPGRVFEGVGVLQEDAARFRLTGERGRGAGLTLEVAC